MSMEAIMTSETTGFRLKVFAVFVVSLAVGSGLVFMNERAILADKKKAAGGFSHDVTYILNRQIDESLSATYALAAMVYQGNGVVRGFDSMASHLLGLHRGSIDSLALAPGAVVSEFYPLKGNEKAIGHDLLKDPERRTEALAAIESRRLTLAGPFQLVQGGTGVIGRLPVFLRDSRGNERFWGFTIAVIHIEALLKAARIGAIEKAGYHYQLWRIHPDSGQRHVFAKSGDFPIAHGFSTSFEIPNGRWTLSIMPIRGLVSLLRLGVESFLALCFASLAGFIALSWLRHPVRLRQEVEARTRDLTATNLMCQEEIAQRKQAEQALKEMNETLEQHVAERTAALGAVMEALRDREKELRLVMDTAPALISYVDSDFRYRRVNKGYERWFGRAAEELIGRHIRDVIGETAWEAVRPDLERAMAGEVITYEREMFYREGGPIWVHVTCVPDREESGGVRGLVTLVIDIGERRRVEEALRERSEELQQLSLTLEQRVRERTADLAALSSELIVAQEEERRRISYDLHDNVWQSLELIRLEVERLFSGDEGDPGVIQRRSRQVISLTRDAVAKIRSMQGDLWPFVLDDVGILATINWYCREFEKNYSGLRIDRQMDLEEEDVPAPAKIVIYRVMQESLRNVVKHSQASRVFLFLVEKDQRIELTIRDNGIGFDPEETLIRRSPWGRAGTSEHEAADRTLRREIRG